MKIPAVSVSQVESNLPGEDRFSVRVTNDISAYAVYDGHGGYLACDIACATLLDMIITDLSFPPSEELTNTRYGLAMDVMTHLQWLCVSNTFPPSTYLTFHGCCCTGLRRSSKQRLSNAMRTF
jgi:hypothetical protein